jgi:hypothetical protein
MERIAIAALCSLPLLVAGCPGSRQPSLIEEVELERTESGEESGYEKREGLHIDIPYLAGQRFEALDPAVVADQLGEEQARRDGAFPGTTEIDYGTRTVGVYEGEVFYVSAQLEYAMDITTAMGVCGFPVQVPRCIEATNECRLVHHWGMRQVSLMREEDNSDRYAEIRVWKFLPRERASTP